jgi:hypothetical protein
LNLKIGEYHSFLIATVLMPKEEKVFLQIRYYSVIRLIQHDPTDQSKTKVSQCVICIKSNNRCQRSLKGMNKDSYYIKKYWKFWIAKVENICQLLFLHSGVSNHSSQAIDSRFELDSFINIFLLFHIFVKIRLIFFSKKMFRNRIYFKFQVHIIDDCLTLGL